MKTTVLTLSACTPRPLAYYLKGLGILRLVAEQVDPLARGWWQDEQFHLLSRLTQEDILKFFLTSYAPTPLTAPWNGGSGYYPKDNKSGIEPIAESQAPRFALFREAITTCREACAGMKESPKDAEKNRLFQACRKRWRGPLLAWFEAAVVLDQDGEPAYPALLGTGGNDGRLDFTNNFMQRLTELFDLTSPLAGPLPGADMLLQAALFAQPQPGLETTPIGQFFPGAAGGANSNVGFGGGPLVNPWDFVLMLEGAVLFASAVTRRTSTESLPQAAAPFAVFSSAVAYASAGEGEKTRGEQWMPIWERPATYQELLAVIGEARCQLQDRPAKRPLDFARAIARLGVARGITSFERYGYIERNGQANLATPLGRWCVPTDPPPHQRLLDEIAPWVDRLRMAAGDKNAPDSIRRAALRCENAMMECCRNADVPRRWMDLLVQLGAAEAQLACSRGFTARKSLQPLGAFGPRLNPAWLLAVNDQSVELRLALALAGQHGPRSVRERGSGDPDTPITEGATGYAPDWSDPVRRHFLPLEGPPEKAARSWTPRRFAGGDERIRNDPAVVCLTGDLEEDMLAMVRRRLIEAAQQHRSNFPLVAVPGTEASIADVKRFIDGEMDDARVLSIARPLMTLDWHAFARLRGTGGRSVLGYPTDYDDRDAAAALGLFGIFRLCHVCGSVAVPLGKDVLENGLEAEVRLDPAVFQRLAVGDLPRAFETAVRRLSAAGLRPHVCRAAGDARLARRLAAALGFPLGTPALCRFVSRLTRPTLEGPQNGAEAEMSE